MHKTPDETVAMSTTLPSKANDMSDQVQQLDSDGCGTGSQGSTNQVLGRANGEAEKIDNYAYRGDAKDAATSDEPQHIQFFHFSCPSPGTTMAALYGGLFKADTGGPSWGDLSPAST